MDRYVYVALAVRPTNTVYPAQKILQHTDTGHKAVSQLGRAIRTRSTFFLICREVPICPFDIEDYI